jgi:hypothetical protein
MPKIFIENAVALSGSKYEEARRDKSFGNTLIKINSTKKPPIK